MIEFLSLYNSHFRVVLAAFVLAACSPRHTFDEVSVPNTIELSQDLKRLFKKTKLACFGRYAIEVPQEAQLIWGGSSFPSTIETLEGGAQTIEQDISRVKKKLKLEDASSQIIYEGVGPIDRSWQLRYYKSEFGKVENNLFFKTYLEKDGRVFVLLDATRDREHESDVIRRQSRRSQTLQLRDLEGVPAEPGYCIEHGFILNDTYGEQEMINAGVYLPSFPDVSFSISSNKDAYSDYPSAEFERMRRELSLLDRIKGAQEAQGSSYPARTVLREGQRILQHWHGEESLFRRKDGTHDFEWALVGRPKDVSNPSEYNVRMFTKVAHNTVGAAKKASLTDEEAIALWDKLLSGLKFRVKVPGAPEGSYYFLPGEKTSAGAKP